MNAANALENAMPTDADLRAERARRQVPVYRIAAAYGCHPNKMSAYLSGREPLTGEVATNIMRAIAQAAERAGR
jgi:hypothetical protein